jgi:hypothetical protein
MQTNRTRTITMHEATGSFLSIPGHPRPGVRLGRASHTATVPSVRYRACQWPRNLRSAGPQAAVRAAAASDQVRHQPASTVPSISPWHVPGPLRGWAAALILIEAHSGSHTMYYVLKELESRSQAARPRDRECPWNESACNGILIQTKRKSNLNFSFLWFEGIFLRHVIDTHQTKLWFCSLMIIGSIKFNFSQ